MTSQLLEKEQAVEEKAASECERSSKKKRVQEGEHTSRRRGAAGSDKGVLEPTPKPKAKTKAKSRGGRNKDLGARGEDAAARYLYMHGYEILERNWECPVGEADIIARDGSALVFVEVKTRTSIEKGFPSEAVNSEKRDRYEKIALLYLKDFEEVDIPVRFDVVSIVVSGKDKALIRHHINAFAAD